MLKQTLFYFVLSLLVVVFSKYAHLVILYVVMFYTYINIKLVPIFTALHFSTMSRQVLMLVLVPIALAGIPALIYRFIKGKPMPHFLESVWLLWFVIVLCKLLIH